MSVFIRLSVQTLGRTSILLHSTFVCIEHSTPGFSRHFEGGISSKQKYSKRRQNIACKLLIRILMNFVIVQGKPEKSQTKN